MSDLYDTWKFENSYGGSWEQGFPITYDSEKIKSEPILEVIVIPHSHCDPGWKHTFEDYYYGSTKWILNGMVRNLESQKEMKFIYAEMSFFELWWKEQTIWIREKVKNFIKSGKLEIVTGGWVMTDEANSHYHSMIVELFEGHEWIKNHLGIEAIPISHWSIDPFGLSPTLPHLLTSANITNSVIQRVHYAVKRELARKKNLEFEWRQLFGETSHPKMRTHMMPFLSYSIPYSCGPDPAVCCQFDFRRLPENGDRTCSWGHQPQKIDDRNVAERAKLLYDQYRKKSQLFRNNVIFVPLGDDFRYEIDSEWSQQYENYLKLMDFMNKQTDWNIHIKFGTLKEYFQKLENRQSQLPTLSGDFFTYADKDDHYWSGYFTTRPFYKQLDRVLQNVLRSAEIAFSVAQMQNALPRQIFKKLMSARRALSLFQHHDGVTGTSTDDVIKDYGKKMISAIHDCEAVLSASLKKILGLKKPSIDLFLDEERENEQVLPEKRIFSLEQNLVIFNSLSRNREDPICIHVDSEKASIQGVPDQQISPVFYFDLEKNRLEMRNNVFELCFSTKLEAMEINSFKIVESENVAKSEVFKNPDEISIENENIKATFDPTSGMIQTIQNLKEDQTTSINANFVYYISRTSKFLETIWAIPMKICEYFFFYSFGRTSRWCEYIEENPPGAYIFLPNGKASRFWREKSEIVIIEGPLIKKVVTTPNKEMKILQTYTLNKADHFLDIDTEIDISSRYDFELALRFDTSIKSGDTFYTDLNGFQMIRRKYRKNLPLQANFYPMSSAVFLEDPTTRFTVHSAQPLGVSSLEPGQVDIILDRRLYADDHRGLRQGIMDNKRTVSHFRLMVEPMDPMDREEDQKVAFHSSASNFATWQLHYSILKMLGSFKTIKSKKHVMIKNQLNCDYHLVTLRSMANPTNYETGETDPKKSASMIVHRVKSDERSRIKLKGQSCSNEDTRIDPTRLFEKIKISRNSTLTGMYEGEAQQFFELMPNDVTNILISW